MRKSRFWCLILLVTRKTSSFVLRQTSIRRLVPASATAEDLPYNGKIYNTWDPRPLILGGTLFLMASFLWFFYIADNGLSAKTDLFSLVLWQAIRVAVRKGPCQMFTTLLVIRMWVFWFWVSSMQIRCFCDWSMEPPSLSISPSQVSSSQVSSSQVSPSQS